MYSENSVYDHLSAATNPSLRPVFLSPLSGRPKEFLLYIYGHAITPLFFGCRCVEDDVFSAVDDAFFAFSSCLFDDDEARLEAAATAQTRGQR